MKHVVSVRLDERAMQRIRELAQNQLSTVARELIEEGWVLVALREYQEGKGLVGDDGGEARIVRRSGDRSTR